MYLDFFYEKGYMIVFSVLLVFVDDLMLLWINFGVVMMKKYFDGFVVLDNFCMMSLQKSIWMNDIENVGWMVWYYMLFEMFGNFLVGDYFKKEVISWVWEFLILLKWFGWDFDKLYMIVYFKDMDVVKFWEVIGVKLDYIIKVEDNFWDIG